MRQTKGIPPFPLVNISSILKKTGIPTVRRDDRSMGRLCARHLLEKGLTRVGIVQMLEQFRLWPYQEALAGFEEGLKEADQEIVISHQNLGPDSVGPEVLLRFRQWLRSLVTPC